jgi:serine/threonine protein kinase
MSATETAADGIVESVFQPPDGGWADGAVDRFMQNLERVRACRHSAVASIVDVQREDGGTIRLRQRADGRRLRELGRLEPARALYVLSTACEALIAAHRQGALHLGLDADSVVFDERAGRVRLIDFGTGWLGRGRAPELAQGVADARTDVFALGALAGEILVETGTVAQQIRRVLERATAAAPADRPPLEDLLRELSAASGLDATLAQSAATDPEDMLAEGSMVAEKYRVVRHIGSGGMGHVYEAEHRILSGKRVALKLLRADIRRLPGMEQRFLQEARTAAELRHPHIVVVEDVENDPQLGPVMVMELLRGSTVERRLRVGRVEAAECLALGVQTLEALEFAHSRGVVHRDIKPANLFVSEPTSLKLLDFGIANNGEAHTSHFEGTPRYASPEQLAQSEHIGQESDIYSLGLTLFEMMTGEYAPRERPLGEKLAAAGIPAAAAAVVARACDPDRAVRFQSAREMREALAAATARPAPRHGFRWLIPAAALLVVALFVTVAIWRARPAPAVPATALVESCQLFASALAGKQLADGSFAALEYNRSTGGETAQVLYALLSAERRCHAPEPGVTLRGLAALDQMKGAHGWSWQSLKEQRLFDSPTASAWAVLALTEADRADRLGAVRPRLRAARELLLHAQLPDGGFPQSIGGDSLVEANPYATVLSLYALVESEAADPTPAATAARERARDWVLASLRAASPDSIRGVGGLEEQTGFVLARARRLLAVHTPADAALADTIAADLLGRCALTNGACRPSLSRNGKLLVRTRKDHPADLLVMFWSPWARLAAAALADEPLLTAAPRAQLAQVAGSMDRELVAARTAVATKDAFELAEVLIATAFSLPEPAHSVQDAPTLQQ